MRAIRMNPDDAAKAAIDTIKVGPPATVAALNMFGYPIADVVQFVMLIWGLCLVTPKLWHFWRWLRRAGWREA